VGKTRLLVAITVIGLFALCVRFVRVTRYDNPSSELVALYKSGAIDTKYRTSEYQIVLLQITRRDSCSLIFWFDPREIQNISYFGQLGSEQKYMKDGNEEPKPFVFWAMVVQSKGRTRAEAHDLIVPKIKEIMMGDPESDCPSVAEG
jgi:hypothetical protein